MNAKEEKKKMHAKVPVFIEGRKRSPTKVRGEQWFPREVFFFKRKRKKLGKLSDEITGQKIRVELYDR